ncbi:YecA family protein [Oceanobacillus luteolus]|uniref:SEC-C metal-binding domain-containing protein n=1 Tax=Oceanobacillus luteolus TaxID=1274358 RepID=A0ABW4HU58_9BACI|nr:SEC-C metal-binding domain-containing protein [Oceanobacillus luteolus]
MNLLFDYVVALTNLYGVVDKEKVIEIYNMQNNPKKNVSDVEALMRNNEDELRKNYVEIEGRYFANDALFVIENELEQLLRKKTGKPYYIPEKAVLLRYKDDEYYEETPQMKKLYRFLEKYVQPDNVNSVEDVFYEVLSDCEMEIQPIDIIHGLEQIDVTFPTEKETIQALKLITNLSNHTRLWSNNGFTPAELFELEKPYLQSISNGEVNKNFPNQPFNQSEKKAGRNDPCPCGSGKKYKKCCLLNV